MKRLLLFILPVIFIACFIACSKPNKETYQIVIEQLEEYEWSKISSYSNEEIEQIEKNINNAGIKISGGVKGITHFFTPSGASNVENTWVYVYDFENEDDAKLFKEQYANSWGNARIKGTVVIYGSAAEAIINLDI